MNAFFYCGRYFLLPEGCANVADLKEKYPPNVPFSATELIEKDCLAPYFITSSQKEVTLTIDGDIDACSCEVEILTRKEYDDRLRRLIPSHCASCPGFQKNFWDRLLGGNHLRVKTHRSELTLDDVCLYRARMDAHAKYPNNYSYYSVHNWMKTFVKKFRSLHLEKLIDAGNVVVAEGKFRELIYHTLTDQVPAIWMDKHEGRYRIIMSTLNSPVDALFFETVCNQLKDAYQDKWEFLHYIPAGTTIPEAEKPLGVSINRVDGTDYRYLTVYCKEQKAAHAYLWLAQEYGEDKLDSVFIERNFVTEEMPADALSADRIGTLIEAQYAELKLENSIFPYPMPIVGVDCPYLEGESVISDEFMLEHTVYISSRITEMEEFFRSVMHGYRPKEEPWMDETEIALHHRPIAQLTFTQTPRPPFTAEDGEQYVQEYEHFHRQLETLFKCLFQGGVVKVFRQVHGLHRFEIDMIVYDLNEFMISLRRWAPFFERHPAELTVHTSSHKLGGKYRLDYRLQKLESEEAFYGRLVPEPEDLDEIDRLSEEYGKLGDPPAGGSFDA
ncbi:MAG: hypothetical protein ACI4U2_02985 [Christensenellaceae bacterium]